MTKEMNTHLNEAPENSKHALSILYKRRTAEHLFGFQKFLRFILVLWVPIALGVIMMSSLWADIQAKGNGAYTPSHNWESCLTSADYQYIVINEILQPKLKAAQGAVRDGLTSCLDKLYKAGTCSDTCLFGIGGTCVLTPQPITIPDPALPTGKFLNGLSYTGIQAVVFSAAGLASMRRALVHPSWLPSTIALVLWFTYGIFCYYTFSPIIPVPGQTNSTLLMYLFYESSSTKYDNFNNGDNQCDTARTYVWLYLTLVILLAFLLLLAGILGIAAERIRYKTLKKHYEPLQHTEIPVILAVLAAIFYWLLSVSKMTSSFNVLNAIDNFNLSKQDAANQGYNIWFPQIYFPLAQPFFDLSTILGIVSVMSIVRGYTIQSISAFRLAFIASLVFTVTTYPGIVGGVEFYDYNNFNDYDDCKNYFLDPATTVAFGYPNDYEAEVYCNSFRLALASSLGFFFIMHFVTIACYYMVTQNEHRNSFVDEDIDFDAIAKDLDINRKSTEAANRPSAPTETANPLSKDRV